MTESDPADMAPDGLLVDGRWQPTSRADPLAVVSLVTEQPIAAASLAPVEDTERGVASTRLAFDGGREEVEESLVTRQVQSHGPRARHPGSETEEDR